MPVSFVIQCDLCQSRDAKDITDALSPRSEVCIDFRLNEGDRQALCDQEAQLGRVWKVVKGEVMCGSCAKAIEDSVKKARIQAKEALRKQ